MSTIGRINYNAKNKPDDCRMEIYPSDAANEIEDIAIVFERFLRWAQRLEGVVIPAGLESDVEEAISKMKQED